MTNYSLIITKLNRRAARYVQGDAMRVNVDYILYKRKLLSAMMMQLNKSNVKHMTGIVADFPVCHIDELNSTLRICERLLQEQMLKQQN